MELGTQFLDAFDVFIKFHLVLNVDLPEELEDFYNFVLSQLNIKENNGTVKCFLIKLDKFNSRKEELSSEGNKDEDVAPVLEIHERHIVEEEFEMKEKNDEVVINLEK